jgi:hypothetical protein
MDLYHTRASNAMRESFAPVSAIFIPTLGPCYDFSLVGA